MAATEGSWWRGDPLTSEESAHRSAGENETRLNLFFFLKKKHDNNTDLLLQESLINKLCLIIQVFAKKMLQLFTCEIFHFFLTIKPFSS